MRHHGGGARLVLGMGLLLAAGACGVSGNSAPPGSGKPKPGAFGRTTGASTAATIDATGGAVSSPDTRLTVVVPPGTVSGPIDITIQEITNTAPGGVGTAYRIGPEGTLFATPVTLTFRPDLTGHALADLAISTQDGQGYWLRPKYVNRDAVAGTISVTTTHFSDWAVVTATTVRDLRGTFSLQSTIDMSFTATGEATLNLAGEDSGGTYYLQWGTITLASAAGAGATCTPATPTFSLLTNIAELHPNPNPTRFDWGISGHWSLLCTATSGATFSQDLDTAFDTLGVNNFDCTRTFVGTPTVSTSHLAGTMVVDCGAKGSSTATWDLQTCNPGVACQPSNTCQTGAITCTTGVPVCTPTGNVADGTACTGGVCGGGVCNACTAGAACTPTTADPCKVYTDVCTTGFPVCTATSNAADGTACPGGFCGGGVCNACVTGAACTPLVPDPCHVYADVCTTGFPVCTLTGNALDGTSCGTNLVCSAGACVCSPGAACTSANPCHTAAIACDATGTPVCTDTGNVADGSACPGGVCGGGVCNACVTGAACTPAVADPCHVHTDVCTTGFPVCTATANAPDNTVCSGGFCAAGACVACTPGAACTPTNVCHVGSQTCTSGPACTDTGVPVADGTSCGTGLTCNAGTCVPSTTVTGTRDLFRWLDSGPQGGVPAPDAVPTAPVPATVKALVPNGAGFDTYPGTFAADGSFAIPNVPTGSYWLVLTDGQGVTHAVQTTATAGIDLGLDVLGRAPTNPSAATTVTFDVSGPDTWAAGDFLQLASPNADVHDLVAGDPLATLTAGPLTEDWFARGLHLLSGDDLYLNRLAAQPTGTLAVPYLASASTAVLPATTVADLTGAALTAALAAPATTGTTSVDWRTTQFTALLASVNAGAVESGQTLAVEASAHPLASTAPLGTGAPALLSIPVGAAQADLTPAASVGYGHLPAFWTEFRRAELAARVTYTVGATPFTVGATIGQREAMPATAPIVPLLGPVGSPAVVTTPATTISWTAPTIGAPTHYTVSIYLLDSTVSAAPVLAATLTTAGLQVTVPPGALAAGKTYVAAIEARALAADGFASAPFRSSLLASYATALTTTFTP